MKNNLPKYWIIKNDGSQLFQDTVIKYLNTINDWNGTVIAYYWFDWNKAFNWTNWWHNINMFENNPIVLTLNEFIEMTTEEFTRWELVEVRDYNNSKRNERIFLVEIKGSNYSFVCVNDNYNEEFKTNKQYFKNLWDRAYNLFIKK